MILITGANGQLGQDFQKLFKEKEMAFIATDSSNLDITDIDAIRDFVEDRKITTMINCAAYNAVDRAEEDYINAYKVNSFAVRNLAFVAN